MSVYCKKIGKKCIVLALSVGLVSISQATIVETFNKIKSDPNALYVFFKKMPKGGELHYHLAGGAYPEAMLEVASTKNYCLQIPGYQVRAENKKCSGISMASLENDAESYNQTLRSWSFQNFIPTRGESANDHFFASFFKFGLIISENRVKLLADVIKRAAAQNVHYMEIMISPDSQALSMAGLPKDLENFERYKQKLLSNPAFNQEVDFIKNTSDDLLRKTRQQMNCKPGSRRAVCTVDVKFIYYVIREQPLEKVFTQALLGFSAAANSVSLIGVNLVAPEAGHYSLRDYHRQMKIFEYMHKTFPAVHIALHAGELTNNLVAPNDLSFHISSALSVGHAQRIGHGVSIATEKNAEKTLAYMAKNKVAVEINLTSNELLLGVKGSAHPLNFYLQHRVPVVLSTDDEGILRTDLTSEYVKAVMVHKLDYPTIKKINRNALSYSFLPGKSLWRGGKPQKPCIDLRSTTCIQFVASNEKARLERDLELKLQQFEREFSQ